MYTDIWMYLILSILSVNKLQHNHVTICVWHKTGAQVRFVRRFLMLEMKMLETAL